MSQNNPQITYLADYLPPVFLIKHVDLHFFLHEQGTRVLSKLHIQRNLLADATVSTLCLNGEGLQSSWVAIDDQRLADDAWSVSDDKLFIPDVPDVCIFSSEVLIAPESNHALEGLYRSGNMFCTQCEAEGFRRITWFVDRPDVMASFQVRIEAEKAHYPVLLSNGNLLDQGDLPDGRHFVVWHDPLPKPCYLFALVAGNLQFVEGQHTTTSGTEITLRIYVEPENIDKCAHAMLALQHAMAWDEQIYGREYDLSLYNIVAANDFNMGAMENKGLNIFNAKYVLARPDTATDVDFQGIEAVIAHEYFHNWTGNRITCRDWFQLSLKEGLTVFRDQEFSADHGSRSVKRIDDVRLLRTQQFAEDASPMAHPVRPASFIEIRNFYTATVYEKGAEVVRMQALLLGPTLYRQAMDLYFDRHDGQAVTIEDFMACMAEVSGRDFSQFKSWYDYAGTPVIRIEDQYDLVRQTYQLRIQQHLPDFPGQSAAPPFLIPIALGLLDAQGRDIWADVYPAGTHLLELDKVDDLYVFNNIAEKPTPSFLRGFSAPVKLIYAYSDEQLLHLMAHDSDGFNRWDAAQRLFVNLILQGVAEFRAGRAISIPAGLVDALRATLLSETVEPALAAEVMCLPSLDYLSDQMPVVDIDGLHHVREFLRKILAEALRTDLLTCYHQLAETGVYQPTPQAIGRRCLKNRVLGYLACLDCAESWDLVIAQYQAQHNMTDVIAALGLIADTDHPQREALLDDFAERWQNDPLVMDKWLSVQAMSCRPDTLEKVHDLMSHPAFSLQNPNKVRALIGAFCSRNPLRFHAVDGSGYDFLSCQAQALDAFNPQIAARLLRGLVRWDRYDLTRQAKMKAALHRLLEGELSKDGYEVVARALGEEVGCAETV